MGRRSKYSPELRERDPSANGEPRATRELEKGQLARLRSSSIVAN